MRPKILCVGGPLDRTYADDMGQQMTVALPFVPEPRRRSCVSNLTPIDIRTATYRLESINSCDWVHGPNSGGRQLSLYVFEGLNMMDVFIMWMGAYGAQPVPIETEEPKHQPVDKPSWAQVLFAMAELREAKMSREWVNSGTPDQGYKLTVEKGDCWAELLMRASEMEGLNSNEIIAVFIKPLFERFDLEEARS